MAFIATSVMVAGGLYQGYAANQAAKVNASNVETQAEQDRLVAIDKMDQEASAASREASEERRKARARRAIIEGQFAKAGVLLDGSATDVLVKQRETDEVNVRNSEISASNRANRQNFSANQNLRQSLFQADAIRTAGRNQLTTSIIGAATSGLSTFNQFATAKAPVTTPTAAPTAFPSPKPLGSLPSSSIGKSTLNFGTPFRTWI